MTPFHYAVREIRYHRAYALLYVTAVGLGAAVLMALSSFGSSLQAVLTSQGRDLATADLVVEGAPEVLGRLESWAVDRWPGARSARTVDLYSMTRPAGPGRRDDTVVQVALRAASAVYPLHGRLLSGRGLPIASSIDTFSLIVEPRLLSHLNARVGDSVLLGTRTFRIADTIASRSDLAVTFFDLAPAAFIRPDDLALTGLVVAGSRTRNRLYLNLPTDAPLAPALVELRAEAQGDPVEIESWETDKPGVWRFLQNTLLFLQFLGLLTLIMGGIAAAATLSAALAAARHGTGIALLLGAPRAWLVSAWLWWIAILGSIGIGVALGLGHLLANLLVPLFGDLLPTGFALAFPIGALAQSAAGSLAASLLFAIAPLLRLGDIPPNAALSDTPVSARRRPLAALGWIVLLAAFFYTLILAQLPKPVVAGWVLGGLAALTLTQVALVKLGLFAIRRVLARVPWTAARLAGRALSRQGGLSDAAVVAIAIALSTVLSIALLQQNITAQFVESWPPDAPDAFFINIRKDQVAAFRDLSGSESPRVHPLIRGRVVAVNGSPANALQQAADQYRNDGDRLTREFGFSYGDEVLATDRVVEGPGLWDPALPGPQVSLFDGFQERYGIRRGDRITFLVVGRRITCTVSSFRAIQTSARQPFFYFYFQPGVLDDAPQTFMAALKIEPGTLSGLERRLASAMPNVTVFDLAEVSALAGRIVARLGRIVAALGGFAVASGLVLLVANILATLVARTREAVLYRTLGARSDQLLFIYGFEYLLLGIVAAAAGWIGAAAASWAVLHYLFRSPWLPFLVETGMLAGGLVAVTVLLALAASRTALKAEPMTVLRYE